MKSGLHNFAHIWAGLNLPIRDSIASLPGGSGPGKRLEWAAFPKYTQNELEIQIPSQIISRYLNASQCSMMCILEM